MPAHGTAPDEVLQLVTRAGGSWWLGLATTRPTATDTTVTLADIPLLEVPRDATAWADPVDGVVQHATGVTMPAAVSDTAAAAWVLFDDAAGTLPRFSRWFEEDRTIPAGLQVFLPGDVLQLEYTPPTYPYL